VPENHATSYAPVATQDRLFTLDVLRGAALLGILLMNIVNFGLPRAAYQNPDLWGGNEAPNLAAFAIHWIFFEGKMRGLFSAMFGAGMVIFMERAAARDNSVRAADLYCRRMLWLMAFGIVHSWLIWSGDILYSYALCGLLLFPLRNLSPKALFITGGAALLAWQVFISANGFLMLSTRNAAVAARAEEAAGRTLTKEQQEARKAWDLPLYGDVCRYYPSCSAYTLTAIQQHGVVKGVGLGAWRIARCHPWAKGGVDDVPAPRVTRYQITRFGFVVATSQGKA